MAEQDSATKKEGQPGDVRGYDVHTGKLRWTFHVVPRADEDGRESWEDEPGLRVHVEAFLVDVEEGWEPELNEEHDEYRWLPREEAADLLFWPEPAALLRSLP